MTQMRDTDRLLRERIAQLEAALTGLASAVRILDVTVNEPAAEGLMSAEDYRSYVQGAWLGVDEAAEKARDALAGPDAQTSGSGSSAADPSVGERQGRQPDPEELNALREIAAPSRPSVTGGITGQTKPAWELRRIAREALAGPDTPADSQEDKT